MIADEAERQNIVSHPDFHLSPGPRTEFPCRSIINSRNKRPQSDICGRNSVSSEPPPIKPRNLSQRCRPSSVRRGRFSGRRSGPARWRRVQREQRLRISRCVSETARAVWRETFSLTPHRRGSSKRKNSSWRVSRKREFVPRCRAAVSDPVLQTLQAQQSAPRSRAQDQAH